MPTVRHAISGRSWQDSMRAVRCLSSAASWRAMAVNPSPARAPSPVPGGRRRPVRRPGARRRGRALRRTGDAPPSLKERASGLNPASAMMSWWRGFTSRIGLAAEAMRPAPASRRSNWRSGPCSAATRHAALSVSAGPKSARRQPRRQASSWRGRGRSPSPQRFPVAARPCRRGAESVRGPPCPGSPT